VKHRQTTKKLVKRQVAHPGDAKKKKPTPGHKVQFDQLLDDAIFGVKGKK